jgi:hypothetical protein
VHAFEPSVGPVKVSDADGGAVDQAELQNGQRAANDSQVAAGVQDLLERIGAIPPRPLHEKLQMTLASLEQNQTVTPRNVARPAITISRHPVYPRPLVAVSTLPDPPPPSHPPCTHHLTVSVLIRPWQQSNAPRELAQKLVMKGFTTMTGRKVEAQELVM